MVAEIVVMEAVDMVRAGFFVFFRCGCLGHIIGVRVVIEVVVGAVEVVCGLKMVVGVDGVGNRGEGVVSSRGNVSVADGGGAKWRDCCRFPNGIFRDLSEDLPSRLPLMLDISDVFL